MGQSAEVSVFQGFATSAPEVTAQGCDIPSSSLPDQRICEYSHGAFCPSKCTYNCREFHKRRICQTHSPCVKARHANTRADTDFTNFHAKNGVVIEIYAAR